MPKSLEKRKWIKPFVGTKHFGESSWADLSNLEIEFHSLNSNRRPLSSHGIVFLRLFDIFKWISGSLNKSLAFFCANLIWEDAKQLELNETRWFVRVKNILPAALEIPQWFRIPIVSLPNIFKNQNVSTKQTQLSDYLKTFWKRWKLRDL